LLPLGHVGIGSRLLGPYRTRFDWRLLYLGCLLPDLLDKPLYYALSFATGRHGAALGLISGTRTVGHTLLFFFLLAALSFRFSRFAPVAAGVATHLLLDNLGDLFGPPVPLSQLTVVALVFPALGVRFPIAPFTDLADHLTRNLTNLYAIAGELIGGAILLAAWLQRRRQSS
jgi:hypothetical protein